MNVVSVPTLGAADQNPEQIILSLFGPKGGTVVNAGITAEVGRSLAIELGDRKLRDAAQALLDAFGGDVPDWVRAEAEALAEALS